MRITLLTIMIIATFTNYGNAQEDTRGQKSFNAKIISSKLKFNEGNVPYGSTLLLSNFGTDELNPLNTQGKGYIVKLDGNKTDIFIAVDGSLSAPKGMAIKDEYLYIADVQKVVVYNLADRSAAARIITLPEGNLFANDIVIHNNTAYISVTNTGKIFKLDIVTPATINETNLTEYVNVVGANGLALKGNSLYIASYPADGNTVKDNVIYKIEDISTPIVLKLINSEGQYDGLAVVGDRLYFTNWVKGEIGYVELKDNTIHKLQIANYIFTGPADMSYLNNKLYISNLPNSELVVLDIMNK